KQGDASMQRQGSKIHTGDQAVAGKARSWRSSLRRQARHAPLIQERCTLKGKMYVWRHPCF
ncbi:MAG: hypothetical protein RSH52_24465, partial [Janthinobacterium sp.]